MFNKNELHHSYALTLQTTFPTTESCNMKYGKDMLSEELIQYTLIDSGGMRSGILTENNKNLTHVEGNLVLLVLTINPKPKRQNLTENTYNKIYCNPVDSKMFSVSISLQKVLECEAQVKELGGKKEISFRLVPRMECTWTIEVRRTYLMFNFTHMFPKTFFHSADSCFCNAHYLKIWHNFIKYTWCLRFIPNTVYVPVDSPGKVFIKISGLHRSDSDETVQSTWKEYRTEHQNIPVSFVYTVADTSKYFNCSDVSRQAIHPSLGKWLNKTIHIKGPFNCRILLLSKSYLVLYFKLASNYSLLDLDTSLVADNVHASLVSNDNNYEFITASQASFLEIRGNHSTRVYIQSVLMASSGCGGRRELPISHKWQAIQCLKRAPETPQGTCNKEFNVTWTLTAPHSLIILRVRMFSIPIHLRDVCREEPDNDILLAISSVHSSFKFHSCGFQIPQTLLFLESVEISVRRRNLQTPFTFSLVISYKQQPETGIIFYTSMFILHSLNS